MGVCTPGSVPGVQRLRRLGHEVDRFYRGSGLVDDVPPWPGSWCVTLVPRPLGLGALATVVFDKGAVRAFAVRRRETADPSSHLDSLTSSSHLGSGQ